MSIEKKELASILQDVSHAISNNDTGALDSAICDLYAQAEKEASSKDTLKRVLRDVADAVVELTTANVTTNNARDVADAVTEMLT